MKKLILIFCLVCSIGAYSYAASLRPSDAELIKDAGVPVFSKAIFVQGSKDIGYRFATSSSSENVKQWYRQQLPTWSVFEEFGSWILYEGSPGLDMGDIVSKNQVMIQKNDRLPGWYSLDKNMTTEIVIMIVK